MESSRVSRKTGEMSQRRVAILTNLGTFGGARPTSVWRCVPVLRSRFTESTHCDVSAGSSVRERARRARSLALVAGEVRSRIWLLHASGSVHLDQGGEWRRGCGRTRSNERPQEQTASAHVSGHKVVQQV